MEVEVSTTRTAAVRVDRRGMRMMGRGGRCIAVGRCRNGRRASGDDEGGMQRLMVSMNRRVSNR